MRACATGHFSQLQLVVIHNQSDFTWIVSEAFRFIYYDYDILYFYWCRRCYIYAFYPHQACGDVTTL